MYSRKFIKLFFLFLILFSHLSCIKRNKIITAEKGFLDLSNWNFKNDNIPLSGEWSFYWKQLLTTKDIKNPQYKKSLTGYFKIPGIWNKYKINHKKLSGDGFATFHLKIKLNKKHKFLAIKCNRFFSAFKIFVNDKNIIEVGKVSINKKNSNPQYSLQVVELGDIKEKVIEIILQVSNFHHIQGGPVDSIVLGLKSKLNIKYYKNFILNIIFFSIGFILFIYHFILFFYRKNDFFLFYFAIYCLLNSLIITSLNQIFISHFFPSLPWEIPRKIAILCICIGPSILLGYFASIFKKSFSPIAVRIFLINGIIGVIITIFFNMKIVYKIFPFYEISAFFPVLYVLIILFKATIHKQYQAFLFFMSVLISILAGFHDFLYQHHIIESTFLIPYVFIFVVISNSIFVAIRTKNALDKIEKKVITITNKKSDFINSSNLTDRQKEITSLILEGLYSKEICDKLNIKLRTVENHIYNIFKKFKVNSRIELISYYNKYLT